MATLKNLNILMHNKISKLYYVPQVFIHIILCNYYTAALPFTLGYGHKVSKQ